MADALPVADTLRVSAWQAKVLAVPEAFDLALLGGRGSGKSYCILWLILRAVEQQGARFRGLYTRATHGSLQDFTANALEVFGRLYGRNVSWNSQSGLFKWASGASLECNQIADAGDLTKYLGRSLSFLANDEVGEYASPDLLDRLRASLRAPAGTPTRVVIAGNAGSAGHAWCASRHVFRCRAPWVPYVETKSGRQFVYCPSDLDDNEFLDRDSYAAQLAAACASDPELLKAWRHNDWTVSRGAFFANCIDQDRNLIEPWDAIPVTDGERWRTWIAHDFGIAAPSVTLLFCESPGGTAYGRFFPRGSQIVIDEFASNRPDDWNIGMGYGVARLSDEIIALCKRWEIRPDGVADDAVFARSGGLTAASVADEFRQCGVHFFAARKADRLSGWTRMRTLLAAAGSLDQPGLYVSRACNGWWQTVPTLPRDSRRPEDCASVNVPDHWADACRYGINHLRRVAKQTDMFPNRFPRRVDRHT